MKNEVKNWQEIKIKVGLNKDSLPVDLKWSVSANSAQGVKDCKAFNLGIWDPVENNSLSINLWTNSMTVDEMNMHYVRNLLNLTKSYVDATKNPLAQNMMKTFCQNLMEETNKLKS